MVTFLDSKILNNFPSWTPSNVFEAPSKQLKIRSFISGYKKNIDKLNKKRKHKMIRSYQP